MAISLIVAMANNNVIGKDGKIPWMGKLSDDMKWFRQATNGNIVVMGRKTFESIGKVLNGRVNIVLSHSYGLELPSGVVHARHIEDVKTFGDMHGDKEIFIIGGAEVYRAMLPFADNLYITEIDAEFEGDTFFPAIDWKDWRLVDMFNGAVNAKNRYPHRFQIWKREK